MQARSVTVDTTPGAIRLRANDDVQLLGEQILLNCERKPPMPRWVPESREQPASLPPAPTSGDDEVVAEMLGMEHARKAVEACELPNLEDPLHLLTPENIVRGDFMLWGWGPLVAGLGWLGYEYFPRSVQFGMSAPPYHTGLLKARDFVEVRMGCVKPASLAFDRPLAERIDPRCVQGSAVGMRMDEVSPAAEVLLENLHPRLSRWAFRLPSDRPRVAVKLPQAPAANLVPKIRTIAIEPDLERVTIVWNAETPLQLPLAPEQVEKTQHGVLWS